MSANNGKKPKQKTQPKADLVGVTLYPGDRQVVDEIKEKHGLIRDSDAIRMAIRAWARIENVASA